MFICIDKCIELYDNWSMSGSLGLCEICGETKICYDIPSKFLRRKIDYTEALLVLSGIKSIGVTVNPEKENFIDDFGNHIVNVHVRNECSGKCTIHNHSEHPLSDKPLLWRNDRKIFEHMCEHGIGHPCPDSLSHNDSGVHGCDRCCMKG